VSKLIKQHCYHLQDPLNIDTHEVFSNLIKLKVKTLLLNNISINKENFKSDLKEINSFISDMKVIDHRSGFGFNVNFELKEYLFDLEDIKKTILKGEIMIYGVNDHMMVLMGLDIDEKKVICMNSTNHAASKFDMGFKTYKVDHVMIQQSDFESESMDLESPIKVKKKHKFGKLKDLNLCRQELLRTINPNDFTELIKQTIVSNKYVKSNKIFVRAHWRRRHVDDNDDNNNDD